MIRVSAFICMMFSTFPIVGFFSAGVFTKQGPRANVNWHSNGVRRDDLHYRAAILGFCQR